MTSLEDSLPVAVVFDVGVVVRDRPLNFARVREILDLGPQAARGIPLDVAVRAARDAYNLGQPAHDYWAGVAQRAGAPAPDSMASEALVHADLVRWRFPDPDVIALVGSLKAAGVRLGVLSNAPRAFADTFRAQRWTSVFSAIVFSCDTGFLKPSSAAYRAAQQALGVEPSRFVIFEDRPEHVLASHTAGHHGVLWAGPSAAASDLARFGVRLT